MLQLLERRNALYERSTARRLRLTESYKFQMFERDCDETKIWINEKLKAASDEGYLVNVCSLFSPRLLAGLCKTLSPHQTSRSPAV